MHYTILVLFCISVQWAHVERSLCQYNEVYLISACISTFKQFEAILRSLNIKPFSVLGIVPPDPHIWDHPPLQFRTLLLKILRTGLIL